MISVYPVLFLALNLALVCQSEGAASLERHDEFMSGGGLGKVKQATAEIQDLVDTVRSAAEEKAGQTFEKYEAKLFKSQTVAGTNYFVKVDVGGGSYVHLRVYQPLPYTGKPAELSDIQLNKTADDEIEYF